MPEANDDLEKWRDRIAPFLQSKLEEFHLLGLDEITMDDFWIFTKESIGRKKEKKPERIHEVVADVMALTVNDYLNKLRTDMFQGSELKIDDSLFK
ncbi:hypothetical protein EWH99_06585 [Sporolactobacillus sp. THM7-7]|nr:hypothetical protein EWH99_06585 [Sporolactobacillus sp. THM7-7]